MFAAVGGPEGTGDFVAEHAERLAGMHKGQVLAGRYRVERVVGVGGMGVVVAARHVDLDSRVALKVLLPALLSNAEAVMRFAREARAAVKIQNEHVARVLDVGTLDNGTPYMVMEFLEGRDLATWLQENGPLPVEQAVDFVLQACVAVADAHGLGIIHRDLKPANLFCTRRSDGRLVIKVVDFGISKVTDSPHASEPPGLSVTGSAAVVGSPFYMSPEQVQSAKDVDARTDLWALGVILFELLTGTVPFHGEAFGELAVKIAVQPPASLRAHRPDAPPALDAVIRRCLEKDRDRRYANVAELAVALMPFASKRARALVERVADIIGAVGLSSSPIAVPSTIPPPPRAWKDAIPGSVAPWAGTLGGSTSKTTILLVLLALGTLGATAGLVIARRASDGARSTAAPIGPRASDEARSTAAPIGPRALDGAGAMPTGLIAPRRPAVASEDVAHGPDPAAGLEQRVPLPAVLAPATDVAPAAAPSPAGPKTAAGGARPMGVLADAAGRVASSEDGYLTINSIPPSICFVDGRQLGATPRTNVPVAPGTHIVKFVDLDGVRSKAIPVTVAAGETKLAVTMFGAKEPNAPVSATTQFAP